jgi:hypothetical protein
MRRLTLAVSLAAAASAADGCSCSDRGLDDPETEPACLWLISPRGTRADGTRPIIDAKEHRRAATVCLCLTDAEYDSLGPREERVGFPEEGTLLDEFNELAYDECTRRAAQIDGLIDDECLDYYEHGTWLKDIYFAEGAWENGTPPGFSCEG